MTDSARPAVTLSPLPPGMKHRFHAMVKPVGSLCNLDCTYCYYLPPCWGECPRNRLVRTPSGEAGLNYLCPGLKSFYAHIQRDMPKILREVSKKLGRSPGAHTAG